jgi:hypothetical protein
MVKKQEDKSLAYGKSILDRDETPKEGESRDNCTLALEKYNGGRCL